jgi:hypothetical protein
MATAVENEFQPCAKDLFLKKKKNRKLGSINSTLFDNEHYIRTASSSLYLIRTSQGMF